MFGGFRIGRLFGINIRVDWSWILIFLLVSWQLGLTFNQVHPEWGTALTWGIAVGTSLLFFASVLAHELAHSLVAKSQGVPVRSITLFLFGGVSNIQREPDSARHEFLMAVVGPLTSIVIGVILLIIVGTTVPLTFPDGVNPLDFFAQLSPALTVAWWLGSINVILGLFNLVPGFPLDGGRVLRSIMWAITDDLHRATRYASWVGQGIGYLMIATGVLMILGVSVPFFGTGFVGGLWLAFIGWYLSSAASASYQQMVVQDILEGVPVSRMMRTNPPEVDARRSVDVLVHDYIMGSDDHSFPVVSDGCFVGLVTLQDVRQVSREQWETTLVEQIMTPADQLVTVSPDEDASDAMTKLGQRDVGQLPVVNDCDLVGLLRRQDIVRWLQLQSESSPRWSKRA